MEFPAKGLLYHYTDQKGLLGDRKDSFGILGSGKIWATHYRFTNDFSEGQEARSFLLEKWAQLAAGGTSQRLSADCMNLRNKEKAAKEKCLEEFLQLFDDYLVSFTDDEEHPGMQGDRLSQWRGYAPDRQGFSLGFEPKKLQGNAEKLAKIRRTKIELLKCSYSEYYKGAVTSCLSTWDCQLMSHLKEVTDLYGLTESQERLLEARSRFKDIGFKEENEWRLAFHTLTAEPHMELIQFRDGRFGRTPYIEVPLGLKDQDSPLKRIVVGPSPNKDQAVIGLGLELAKMGIHGVEVVPSKIPFRNV